MAKAASGASTVQVDLGQVPNHLVDYEDPLLGWVAAPAMQGQNTALKAFEERINSVADPLSMDEKREHYHDMFMTLYAASQAPGGMQANFDFAEQAKIYPPSEAAQKYLDKCRKINPNENQPTMVVAAVLNKLGKSHSSPHTDLRKGVKRIINVEAAKYNNARRETIQRDVARQGIIVDNNGTKEAFYDIKEFEKWGDKNGLSGEQQGLIIAHASQGVALGVESPLLNMQGHFHKEKGMHPGLLVKMSGDKVTLQTQISGGSPMVNGEPTAISTLKADITDFKANTYKPSVTSKPLKYDYKLTLVNDSEYPADVAAPLINVGGKQIASDIHYKEYIENTFTALKHIHQGDLATENKATGERDFDYAKVGEFIEQTIPHQMHDLMHNKIINNIQEKNTQQGVAPLDIDQAVKDLDTYGKSFKTHNNNEFNKNPRKAMLKYAAEKGVKVQAKSFKGKVQNLFAKISITLDKIRPKKVQHLAAPRTPSITPISKQERPQGQKHTQKITQKLTKEQRVEMAKKLKKGLQASSPSMSGKKARRVANRMAHKQSGMGM